MGFSEFVDKVVGVFSPRMAYERAQYRHAADAVRSYDAGYSGHPFNANWNAVNQPAEADMQFNRDIIRARARDMEQNSDVMNALLSARERNIIGNGYQLQARTPSEKLNSEIEGLWRRWCRARNCDITRQQSLMDMMRMIVRRKAVDGAVLIIKNMVRLTKRDDRMLPFTLRIAEVDELDGGAVPGNVGNRTTGGVEYDANGAPVAYWVQDYMPDGTLAMTARRIKAERVIYYATKTRPTQLREMSDMAHTLMRVRDLNELISAYGRKQFVEACFAVFLTTETPQTYGRKSDELVGQDYNGKRVEPGMIGRLRPGEKPAAINPTGQSADAASMVKLMLRLIAAGQGVSYEALSRDLSETNYSSARQGAIEDELAFAADVAAVTAILDEIYETFVISLAQNRALNISIDEFWRRKDEYLAHQWIKEPKKWIDPVKEANAIKIALSTGAQTYQQVAAANGMDWRESLEAMKDVLEYADEIGLNVAGALYDGKTSLVTDEPEAGPLQEQEGGEEVGASDANDTSPDTKTEK